jgi:hypothetical protein
LFHASNIIPLRSLPSLPPRLPPPSQSVTFNKGCLVERCFS